VTPPAALSILDIAEFLDARDQVSDPALASLPVRRPASVGDAGDGDVAFVGAHGTAAVETLRTTRATLVIVADDAEVPIGVRLPAILRCPNPRLAFIRVLERFFAPQRPCGIHPRAVVDDRAEVASSAYVGPLATVGSGVRIGERTVIHAGVHIYPGCTIGADCTVHSGVVIGADGFGYERSEDGAPVHFPHVGTVVIEEGVEIGANAAIDRGSLGATIIRAHARIDNLVYIAHNVEVGQGALVVGSAMIAGGARLGARSWIAPSIICDGVAVGDDAVVGLGSVVLADVPAGATVAGNPAREMAELRAVNAALRRLIAAAESGPADR
jgi:UDP-3-O-[3-hydroxymyristoyl] glucosamine N-acyltransferase